MLASAIASWLIVRTHHTRVGSLKRFARGDCDRRRRLLLRQDPNEAELDRGERRGGTRVASFATPSRRRRDLVRIEAISSVGDRIRLLRKHDPCAGITGGVSRTTLQFSVTTAGGCGTVFGVGTGSAQVSGDTMTGSISSGTESAQFSATRQ
jgi:hypothetical protein